ncbi:MAG: NHL repeat-containing protein [Planctomycetota bacterium]|jgi:hypothetical protein
MKNQTGKIQSGILTGLVLVVAIGAGLVAFFLFDASDTKSKLAPEYRYDIESYAKIDPGLIIYEQIGEAIETDFDKTTAIAIGSGGKVYIAGDEKIVIYEPDFVTSKTIETGSPPTCVEIDSNDTMIICVDNFILFIDSMGVEAARWIVPANNAILTSIATDKTNVFVADAVNKFIWRFDRDGKIVGKIGQKDPDRNIPGIVIPSAYFDIASYPDGLLRVVNPGRHWIEAYTVEGDREWYWGTSGVDIIGFSGCCNPVALAILPDGGFVTAEKGLVRVKVYDADGEFVGVVAGPDQLGWIEPLRVCKTPEECKAKGFDLAADGRGRIYVLDTLRNVVRVFEKK